MRPHPNEVQEALVHAGVPPVSSEAAEKLTAYLDLLVRWNTRMNLTSVRTRGGMLERHIVEGVFAAQELGPGIETLLDFGSGAGIPGVPISILRPEMRVLLAETRQKKAAFLREVVRVVGLHETEVHAGRVEALPAEQRFQAVTMRAVDSMLDMVPIARGRVLPGGELLLMVGTGAAEFRARARDVENWREIPLPGRASSSLLIGTVEA